MESSFNDLKFVIGEILRRYERETKETIGCLLYRPISDSNVVSYDFNGETFEELKDGDEHANIIQAIN
jgi:hypothetical protein